MKNRTCTFRCSDKTLDSIEEIRKQMKQNSFFDDKNLTNGYIIRLAIRIFKTHFKYMVWVKEK